MSDDWTYEQPTYPGPAATDAVPTGTAPTGYLPPAYWPPNQPPTGYGPTAYGPAGYGATGYGSAGYGPSGYGPSAYWPPLAQPPAGRQRRRHTGLAVGLICALSALAVGVAIGVGATNGVPGSGALSASGLTPHGTGTSGSSGNGSGGGSGGRFGGGSSGGGSTTGGATSTGTASAAEQVGVVDIDTVLKYEGAQAAGTGLVLTSNGEILTNNHVVDGATGITVTVVSTGKTYTASVVGTDATDDIAVLRLSGASGLKTAKISTSAVVTVGAPVTAVGNAGGVGGTPSTASGTVVAVDQAITASDDNGQNPENLTGLIESNAPIEAGDSGGPLYNAAGQIIGIDTAGSTGADAQDEDAAATEAFSIPISHAVTIAGEIVSGKASTTIHLGNPPFLGIELPSSGSTGGSGGFGGGSSQSSAGVVIAGVVPGTPAEAAGLTAGDTITTIGATSIASASELQSALSHYSAGQSVKIAWIDTSGQSHSATVTLIVGPAA